MIDSVTTAQAMPPSMPSSTTPSGIEIPQVATADMVKSDPGQPGEYPFTRGIFPNGYRGRLWTIRQYSGFGSAEETNQRYRFLLDQGQTGLSVALDLPTQCGYDPTDAMARSEVGKVGVSIATLADMEILLDGIDLASISTSFTINGTAPMIYAMYLAAADKKGVPRESLTGTIQNDILKEYVARGTWIFPVRPSLRLIADSILFSNEATPRFNPISIAGAHVRDAGSTAVEEMGFTLANGLAYVDEMLRRGGDVNHFAKRLSFFFYVHMDFFEEICKFRAGRRVWARLMQGRYGVTDPKALMFRFGVVCGGSSLTAAQPYNNIVRVGIENMAAVFGGAQSIFTAAYDEAYQIPTEFSAETALRTQQMVAYESGISKTVDPLGGSYYVEYLTDEMDAAITKVIAEIEDYGGAEKAIEDGYLQSRIAQRALERKLQTDAGERVVVGQNHFRREDEDANDFGEVFKLDTKIVGQTVDHFNKVRAERDGAAAAKALEKLSRAAAGDAENLLPHMIDCCHAYVSIGEMVDALKDHWGEFQEPVGL
ncbi:MAG: methylmalonyl-CoA mutase family protein [Alphaproteobacteria bacterium]|jgi:methylmalonyl-CoA mutase N-terminal domain/subunit|nr:methylmalonyl-CoA mutase family protein [Alphaproteobacteria bacterium]MDP6254450.1 methylmalonyl-CoA mutase family protein [Alphaproteobacteria bacterium]MDP7053781.1 methylmalonyl-CoA mutase family protein [Alphaproteobacteria bacterium]MDP7227693.1 methylmalonyl-CoA mutase family protein [Alphaproteobacteria bacterium]MDP7459479.1 methylmalonyl-CoA mutase family protein [Alphaproteobacteria bacterium]|tara:strand:+ start:5279 stop:6901 length:1623 start_codon:yes stop_codon:yes gene_type:complete